MSLDLVLASRWLSSLRIAGCLGLMDAFRHQRRDEVLELDRYGMGVDRMDGKTVAVYAHCSSVWFVRLLL